MRRVLCAFLLAACLLPATVQADQQLVEIRTPSEHVAPEDVTFNGADHPKQLRAKVLLPRGYDGRARFPVLYLLHGVGDRWDSWSDPRKGAILETARGLDAIVVMPEAARGFYANHFRGGKRGEPGWERFYLDELIPLVEDRFRILPGRRNRAVAGLSMGGFGTMLLASRRPDYFGTAASFSGALNIQRPEFAPAVQAGFRVDYERIFGPPDGPYATGHNPVALVENLRSTNLYVTTGDGTPAPEHAGSANPFAGAAEAGLRTQNDDFVASLRGAGIDVTYVPRSGQHDWPYWREHLQAATRWGLFRPAVGSPGSWTYSTVSRTGRMWGLLFAFERAPEEVVRFTMADGRLSSAGGTGSVTLRTPDGCSAVAVLPLDGVVPPGGCETAGRARIALTARPAVVRRGVRTTIRFRTFTRLADGTRETVAGALVRFAGKRRRTDGDGIARLRVRLAGRLGTRTASAVKPGLARGTIRVRVVRPSR